MNALLGAITAACNAYSSWVAWQRETEVDRIEDEIDNLAAVGDAASKLRLERLAKRLSRKRERIGAI
jgi:hypothetical protein